MRAVTAALALVLFGSAALAAEKKPKAEDDCARQSAACEKRCDARSDMERLSCKTDCRLAETQCRNGKR